MLAFAAACAAAASLNQANLSDSPPNSPPTTPQVTSPIDPPATEVEGVVVVAPNLNPVPDWADKIDLDPDGIYTPSEKPYLQRRPDNGCKIMGGGATDAMGKSGAAGGFVCVKRF